MNILEPIPVKMGTDEDSNRKLFVHTQLRDTIQGLKEVHESKLQAWRDTYDGIPKEKKKSFPWVGASNIVVQLVAQVVDTLVAQCIGSIYEIMPLFSLKLAGEWDAASHGDEMREALEEFLNLMGLEPHELDLYRVENVWFSNACKYGAAVCKLPWEHQVEQEVMGVRSDGMPESRDFTKYSGPRPEAIPFDRFGITPTATKLETAGFKWHKITLKKYELEERGYTGKYDKEAVTKILNQSDRGGPDANTSAVQNATGAREQQGGELSQEWDLYECHYPYGVTIGSSYKKYRIIETYHYKSKTSLRAIFNPFPANDEQFIGAKLGHSDRGWFEMGFCEMLNHYQEEVTAQHNRYADNATLANTNALRVDPDSKLDSNFSIYPMCVLPFKQGEVEIMQLGRANNGGIDQENQVFNLVKARTGVDQGVSGSGSGITNPKRGIYSAMGTFAVMQAGNRRSNIRITDMRTAHIELGRKCLRLYSEFGVGNRLERFGKMSEWIKEGLQKYKMGKIDLPVRAATASINKELEKQNDMMLVNILNQHYQQIGAILQGVQTQQGPMQEYLVNVVMASDSLMRHILRNFGHDDVSRLLPVPQFIKELRDGKQQGAASGEPGFSFGGTSTQAAGGVELSQSGLPISQSGSGMAQTTGV